VAGDAVHGDALARERPQPGAQASHPPAGLIRRDGRARRDPCDQRLVGRLAAPGRTGDRLAHPARSDPQAELAEQPRDLARRQPQALAAPGSQRDRARAKLHGRRAQRIGGLLGMARLHPAAAHPAAADRHLVAADLGLLGCGQVLLVLAGDPLHAKLAATPRAHRRQPHRHDPVDPTGHRPPRMPPVRLAGLAARPSGVGGGPVLGERRGLALARPPQLLDLGDQVPDPGFEPLVVCRQPLDLTDQPVTLDPHRLALGLHHRDPLAQPGHGLALLVGAPALRPCHRGANHTP